MKESQIADLLHRIKNTDIKNDEELMEFKYDFAMLLKGGKAGQSSEIATQCRLRISRYENK